jgi:hypothetical protein
VKIFPSIAIIRPTPRYTEFPQARDGDVQHQTIFAAAAKKHHPSFAALTGGLNVFDLVEAHGQGLWVCIVFGYYSDLGNVYKCLNLFVCPTVCQSHVNRRVTTHLFLKTEFVEGMGGMQKRKEKVKLFE